MGCLGKMAENVSDVNHKSKGNLLAMGLKLVYCARLTVCMCAHKRVFFYWQENDIVGVASLNFVIVV